jgi:beta-1,2-mannobiose phosphorylase / 1,2-beta-oligomannan phosphorylase
MEERFEVSDIRELNLELPPEIAGMYVLSPYVWKDRGTYCMLLRVVNPDDNSEFKVSRVHYGECPAGIDFKMEPVPVIAPGPGDEDIGGCEDPTLCITGGNYWVYYTGWNPKARQALLLHAVGPEVHQLRKLGTVLPPSDNYRWSKEVTIAPAADGTWRLLFEYSHEDKSKIGVASAAHPSGPWKYDAPSLFARPDKWDNWHLSTGPVIVRDGRNPVMFYNGATRNAMWRIGWAEFDPNYTRVVTRSDDYLIDPGIVNGSDTDIAFAASAVAEGDDIFLYYSISDRILLRAKLRDLS